MNAATLDDLRPRPRDRLSGGAALALVAHALLVVALSLGVSWRSSEPPGVEAELWAAVPQVAAPRAVEPEAAKPPPTPTPEPPKPTPRVEPPPPPPPVNRDAEIAQQRREQEELLAKRRVEEERLEAQRRAQEQREKEREQKEREREEQQRLKAEQAKREADKKRVEAERQKKLEAEQEARIEAQRIANMKRIEGQLNATGAPGSTGTAAQSAGPSASYAGRIKARIKPNIVFTEDVPGNPIASVEVRLAPDGTIVGRRLVKSSGVPSWDQAVLRAIDKTEVLPRDTDGTVPPSFEIDFRPRDL